MGSQDRDQDGPRRRTMRRDEWTGRHDLSLATKTATATALLTRWLLAPKARSSPPWSCPHISRSLTWSPPAGPTLPPSHSSPQVNPTTPATGPTASRGTQVCVLCNSTDARPATRTAFAVHQPHPLLQGPAHRTARRRKQPWIQTRLGRGRTPVAGTTTREAVTPRSRQAWSTPASCRSSLR